MLVSIRMKRPGNSGARNLLAQSRHRVQRILKVEVVGGVVPGQKEHLVAAASCELFGDGKLRIVEVTQQTSASSLRGRVGRGLGLWGLEGCHWGRGLGISEGCCVINGQGWVDKGKGI